MKKKIIIGLLLVSVISVVSFKLFQNSTSNINPEVLTDLEGTIYFTERVDGVLTLFKSDANLQNKTLVYSHNGKGNDGLGDYNDNIIEFYYNQAEETVYFIAMDNGSWSLFSLRDGEETPTVMQKEVMEIETDYIQNKTENGTASSKKGSLYLLSEGNEKIIKKFHGLYDEKFTGYRPTGFSPDGQYLVYHSMEHATPLGTILKGMVEDSVGNTYVMDLSTLESAEYVDAHNIQWVEE
ncbi:hypothetical protein [Sutcliffiella horikoshii]|uniref:hypothetical protein n=1 Tax=Sutcliffiella horikoshii TaxID=79883 RepID=UPI001CFC7F09|nr:hypothetical protein [Sutcliffiella horikoshii]